MHQLNAYDFMTHTRITDEAAEFISKYRGESISLNGLTELSAASAESLSKFRGECISFCGLTELSAGETPALPYEEAASYLASSVSKSSVFS